MSTNETNRAPQTDQTEDQSSAPARGGGLSKKRKRGIAAVVVALVVILAGVGFWEWHETPGFCAAVCHNMDSYLATYEEDKGVPGTDKYGNPVSNTDAMLATFHRDNRTSGKNDFRCMDCHHPVLAEQVNEAFGWVTGNYYDPLVERVGDDITHWWGEPGNKFCVNENCHAYLRDANGDVDYDKLENTTVWMDFNPHAQHHDIRMDCTECHKGHRASVHQCSGCHKDITLPDGWLTKAEGDQLMLEKFGTPTVHE